MAKGPIFSDDAFEWIIAQVADGASLSSLVNQRGCPTNGQFHHWLRQSKKRQQAYNDAKAARAEWLIAKNELLAADRTRDVLRGPGGIPVGHNPTAVRRDELQIRQNQWLAERLNRAVYGQHVQQELSGPGGTQLIIGDSKAAAEIARKRREGRGDE